MKRVFVQPAREGLKVPNLQTGRFLLPQGEEVKWGTYWSRLLKSKSITVREPESKNKVGGKK